ncbi:autotransporter assembly complex protein TamA [Paracoccus tibetensis]|uniref:Autotransporter secretion outer membrane protein TamA n=1 Tax=Paracoccus tibetensis TaxID=336292 RepID=A0A1G5EF28_9RHOB|nr:autotransporter assembly complex family protein [Paracoccus tibetensis]SCY25371.1 autotransporter secretion outer membrane protein TamA [Paracoccus tibetensis]
MRAIIGAVLAVTTALGGVLLAPVGAGAQSTNPFSGLFGGRADDGPVRLEFRVSGGDDDLERAFRNTSLIAGALAEDRVTGQDVLAAARGDYARILGVLYDEGYYSSSVSIQLDGIEAAEVAPLDAPEFIRNAIVVVEPGPRFRFSRAQIAPVAPGSEIPDGYRAGEVAGTGVMRRAAIAGVDGWRAAGHAKADLAAEQITADHNAAQVDSRIALAPGPAVTFGQMRVSGNQRLNERRLRKIAGFPEGQRFDPEDLDTVRQRLRRTGVFSAVTLTEAEQLSPGNVLDVDLTVVEQRPRRVGAGFEISNTEGAQVSAYWMHRNLLGGAERLRIEGRVSNIGSQTTDRNDELSLRIDRPATVTPDTTAYFETRIARTREEDYDEDSASVALGFNHIFSDRLTADAALQYRASRVFDANGRTDFRVLALPMNVLWDQRDEPNNAKRGYYLSGGLMPFRGFGDTGSGAQATGEGRAFASFGEGDRFTLAGRGRLGTILGSEIDTTPRGYLFYSGGGGSVRGHPFRSLGAEVIPGPDGPIKTGGMSVANASAEFRFQVRERIGIVAFADYGRVWTDSSFGGDSGDQAGAGVGVRYDTPVGPLRFDVAGPVSGDTGDGVQLYLGLGQAF